MEVTIVTKSEFNNGFIIRAVPIDAIIGGGGGVLIYSRSHTVKTIAFKRNPPGRTRMGVTLV